MILPAFEDELVKLGMVPMMTPGSMSRAAAQLRMPKAFVPRAATPGTFGIRDALKSAAEDRGDARVLRDLPAAIGATALGYGFGHLGTKFVLDRLLMGGAAPSWVKYAPAIAGAATATGVLAGSAAHAAMRRRREGT